MFESQFHNIAVDNISKIINHLDVIKESILKPCTTGVDWNVCNSSFLDVNIEQIVLVYSYTKFKTKLTVYICENKYFLFKGGGFCC